ncbi:outer membrane protein transport protein [Vibrio sp. Y2-5]|uniref:OmpP1/FadL family transporter n=1 Tax=Vibrio sp. Y2-5 TaxID=2743977 RepID=UPI001660DDD5|nr:outer membrane protein transport protein [Vibrio sp. Y2-5]MBD0785261.1 outer membrane protein transport protein [Vibrio sp. Y2-5]
MNLLKKPLIASTILASTSAYSAGVLLSELGTNDVGLTSAGKAARAQDASVMAANPAGLSNVEGQSFTGGLMALYGDTEYQMDNGNSAGNIVGFVPLGSAFYSQQMNDKVTLGLGVYGTYGLGLEYDNFPIKTAVTQALTIQPTASYKINDQWSVGAGVGIQYGMFDIDANLGTDIKEDDTDIAYNAKLGLLYSLNADTRLGLGYSSETELSFDGGAMGTQKALIPQTLVFSAFHQLNDKLAIMGNLGWEDWSEYDTLTGTPTEDTYHLSVGSRYQINQRLVWNAGVAFDSGMYKNQSAGDFTVPTGDAWRIGTGAEYTLSNGSTIGLAFEVALIDDSKVNAAEFGAYGQGSFNDPTLYFLTTTYTWSGH